MEKVLNIAWVTCKEGLRERVFIGVLLFILFLLLLSGVLAELSIGNTLKVTQDIGLSGLALLGLFIALFLSTQLMAKDLDKKTVFLVLSKPVSRGQYITGKFLGLCLLNLFALLAGFVFYLLALFFFYKTSNLIQLPEIAWFKQIVCFGFLLVEMFLVTAIGVFFSSFSSSGLLSFFFSLIVYFIGANLNNVKLILKSEIGENVSPVFKYIFNAAYWFLPNISLLDLKSQAVHGLELSFLGTAPHLLYGVCYILALLFLACAIFQHRELG